MQLHNQMGIRGNPKNMQYLKENSHYIKYLNRGVIDHKKFASSMKELHKERVTDKVGNVMENMELISSVLNVLK